MSARPSSCIAPVSAARARRAQEARRRAAGCRADRQPEEQLPDRSRGASPASGHAPALRCRSNEPAGAPTGRREKKAERGQRVGGQAAEAGAEIGHGRVRRRAGERRARGIATSSADLINPPTARENPRPRRSLERSDDAARRDRPALRRHPAARRRSARPGRGCRGGGRARATRC